MKNSTVVSVLKQKSRKLQPEPTHQKNGKNGDKKFSSSCFTSTPKFLVRIARRYVYFYVFQQQQQIGKYLQSSKLLKKCIFNWMLRRNGRELNSRRLKDVRPKTRPQNFRKSTGAPSLEAICGIFCRAAFLPLPSNPRSFLVAE